MVVKLYIALLSAPARAVLLTAEALGLKVNIQHVDLLKQEQLSPEFIKLNPQHTVPMIEDEGTVIWDSHAIMTYLVSKYGKDDSLYPKDLARRALVDQRLHFEGGLVFPSIPRIIRHIRKNNLKEITEENRKDVLKSYDFLNKFLEGSQWAAGNSVTIADFSLVTSITNLNTIVPVDKVKYSNIELWLNNVSKLPYYKVNVEGVEAFRSFINSLLK